MWQTLPRDEDKSPFLLHEKERLLSNPKAQRLVAGMIEKFEGEEYELRKHAAACHLFSVYQPREIRLWKNYFTVVNQGAPRSVKDKAAFLWVQFRTFFLSTVSPANIQKMDQIFLTLCVGSEEPHLLNMSLQLPLHKIVISLPSARSLQKGLLPHLEGESQRLRFKETLLSLLEYFGPETAEREEVLKFLSKTNEQALFSSC